MPKAFFYTNIVYFITFKWNIELLQIFMFELVQYTFYRYFLGGHFNTVSNSTFCSSLEISSSAIFIFQREMMKYI